MGALVALVIGFLVGRCQGDEPERVVITEKSIPVRFVMPGIEVTKIATRYVERFSDTNGVALATHERDSLRLLLKKKGASVSWGIDSITPERDTFRIDCDEITRQIKARMRFAARDTIVRYLDTASSSMAPSRWGLSVGAGASATMTPTSVVVSPGVFLGLTYTFIRF